MVPYHKNVADRLNRPPKNRGLNRTIGAAHEQHSRSTTGNPDYQRTFVRAPANNIPGRMQDLPLHTAPEKSTVAPHKPPDSNTPFSRFTQQSPVQSRGS